MCSRAHASCWSVSEPLGGEEQVKIKGVENWGKNMERGWILANRANARASFNNSNEPITRSRCKSARVDLVRGGLRTRRLRAFGFQAELCAFKPLISSPLMHIHVLLRLYVIIFMYALSVCITLWLWNLKIIKGSALGKFSLLMFIYVVICCN